MYPLGSKDCTVTNFEHVAKIILDRNILNDICKITLSHRKENVQVMV